MSGWGSGSEGSSPWGTGIEALFSTAPIIDPIDPLDGAAGVGQSRPVSLRIRDLAFIDPASIFVSVDGIQYVLGGVAVNGAAVTIATNTYNGYDVTVQPPVQYQLNSSVEVQAIATNGSGETTTRVYSFNTGAGPRLIKVTNPAPTILLADFNYPMRLDDNFRNVANWEIQPVSEGAAPLTITAVSAKGSVGNRAMLTYTGGGSFYELIVHNLVSADGDEISPDYDSYIFEIVYGQEAEPTVRLFNSVFGPLGISQRVVTRRNIDRHTANRSLALALDEQIRLRRQQLDGTQGRDGRPGATRGA